YAIQSNGVIAIALEPEHLRLIGVAEARGGVHKCVENRLQLDSGAADDLEHLGSRRLPFVRLLELAGKSAHLLLQVGNGCSCGRYFQSLGPVRALTLNRLLASTALSHLAPLKGGHDEAQSYANPEFLAMAGRSLRVLAV